MCLFSFSKATGNVTVASTATNELCPGDCNGTIATMVSGGSGNYTYSWSPGGQTTPNLAALCAGQYIVQVTDSGVGATSTIYLEDFDSIVQTWTLNVVSGVNGADSNFWVINDNEGGVAPTGCGTANNGDNTLHITSVFNPAGGAAYNAGGLCGILPPPFGGCPQTSLRAESPAISTIGNSNLNLSFDFISAGDALLDNASVFYNDGSGWTLLTASVKSLCCGSVPCVGGVQGEWTSYSMALPASCNNIPNLRIGINWENNDDTTGTDPSVAINNVRITSASAVVCVVSDTINITTLSTPINANLTSVNPGCGLANGSITANYLSGGIPPFSYQLNANPVQTGNVFSNLSSGPYSVRIIDSLGCDTTIVTTLSTPSGNFVYNISAIQPGCTSPNGSITINVTSGSNPPYQYSINSGAYNSNPSYTNLVAGNYTLSIRDTVGCDTTFTYNLAATFGFLVDTFSVNIKNVTCSSNSVCPNPAKIDSSVFCPAVVIPVCGCDGVTYNNSCEAQSFGGVTVWVPGVCGTVPTPVVGSDGAITGIAVVAGTGTPPFTFAWYNAVGMLVGNNIDLYAQPVGNYTLIVTDSAGCIDTVGPYSILQNPNPVINSSMVNITDAACGASNGSIMGLTATGQAPLTFTWTNTIGDTVGNAANLTGMPQGAYTVTVADQGCCTASAGPFLIASAGGATIDTSLMIINGSQCDTILGSVSGLQVSGGVSPYTFQWTNMTGVVGNMLNLAGVVAGQYTLTVTDSTNCASSIIVNVPGNVPIVVDTSALVIIDISCSNNRGSVSGTLVSGGNPPYTIKWTNLGTGATESDSIDLSTISPGSYMFEVKDADSCSAILGPFTIQQLSTPLQVTLDVVDASCNLPNGQININITGGNEPYSVAWSHDTTVTDTFANNLPAGPYTLTIYDADSCSTVVSTSIGNAGGVTITMPDEISIQLGFGGEVIVTQVVPNNNVIYQWSPDDDLSCNDCPFPIASPTRSTWYYLQVTDTATGCIGLDSVLVRVLDADYFIEFPNAFTPNEDVANDFFYPRYFGVDDYQFSIFDRWGEEVFGSTNLLDRWDGTFKGRKLNPTVFVWTVQGSFVNGKTFNKSGSVTLIR